MPGLRREELALLAGVSASYYTRLEQGQSPNASPEVLDAIARALRLDDAERAHLHDLAAVDPPPGRPARPAPERVDGGDVGSWWRRSGDVPALVLGRRSDVLAWNTAGPRAVRRAPGPGAAGPAGPASEHGAAGVPRRAHP